MFMFSLRHTLTHTSFVSSEPNVGYRSATHRGHKRHLHRGQCTNGNNTPAPTSGADTHTYIRTHDCIAVAVLFFPQGTITGTMDFLKVERKVCLSWASSYILAQLLTAVAAAAVSVVNRFLNGSITFLVEYERHNSASEVSGRGVHVHVHVRVCEGEGVCLHAHAPGPPALQHCPPTSPPPQPT
jgi:hypothetical protein